MRKNVLFIMLICATTVMFAQSKKSMLTAINTFKNQQIKNACFNTTKDSLHQVITTYFTQQNYRPGKSPKDSLIVYKILVCRGEKQFIDKNTKTDNRIYRKFQITTTFIQSKNNKWQPQFYSELIDDYTSAYAYNQDVLSSGTSSMKVTSTPYKCYVKNKQFSYNPMEIKRFLYVHFIGPTIPLSEDLNSKIEHYNAAQKKEKKKIIAGRDY